MHYPLSHTLFTYPSTFFVPSLNHEYSFLTTNKRRMPRRWAIHLLPLPFLFVLIQLSILKRATIAADIVEFLFQNQRICGEPFADAQWVPVLDLCELECKADEEICMEDDQMKQSCRKLPTECTRAFRAQQTANLHKGIVQIDKKAKEMQNRLAKPSPSTPRPVLIGKNSIATIPAALNGEGEANSLIRSARSKKQSRRKLRANASGKTRQIPKSYTGGKKEKEEQLKWRQLGIEGIKTKKGSNKRRGNAIKATTMERDYEEEEETEWPKLI